MSASCENTLGARASGPPNAPAESARHYFKVSARFSSGGAAVSDLVDTNGLRSQVFIVCDVREHMDESLDE